MEENVTVMMVPLDELLGYCRASAEDARKMRDKSKEALFKDDLSDAAYGALVRAVEYFADEYCRWEYDIPNAIKRVAYGEAWKEKTMVERRGDD